MADNANSTHGHKRLWIGAAVGAALLAVFIGLAWYLRSPSFEDLVRRRLITNLHEVSGGRVEMASFHWNLSRLAFEANDLTIHGLEPAGELPLAHVDHALVRLHIISLVERRFNLEQVHLQRPVVHLIIYPDGTTNVPEPKIKSQSRKAAVQQLFKLAIARADLRDGMLLVNDRKLPLNFDANDIAAAMSHDAFARRYDGSVQVGKMDVQYAGYRDVPAQADLHFTLEHNSADIKSLKLTSQASSLQLAGTITNFDNPQLQVTYSSAIDVAQLGAIARAPQLRAGTLLLDGSASYSEGASVASTGRIALRDLDYLDDGTAIRKANLDSNFSIAGDRLTLTRIAGRLLGGVVTGDADIRNILSIAPATSAAVRAEPVAKPRKRAREGSRPDRTSATNIAHPQQGSARLRLRDLSLNELARMISTRALPLDKLKPVGSVSGSVGLAWKGSFPDAVADLALDITAPAQASGNQLPISGSLRGRYSVHSGRTELAALDLTTPHSHVDATGTLSTISADLKLNLNTTSLTEFQPMLTAMAAAPLPVELAGATSFKGTLNGRLRAPEIAGHLQATDFTYIYTPASFAPVPPPQPPAKRKSWFRAASNPAPPPPPPAEPPRRIHIDQFAGDIQYSQSELALHHAVIHEAGAQLNLDGAATLERGDFTPDSQFQLQAALHNGDIAELQRAAATDYPLTGSLNFTLRAAGTPADPHGQGQVSLTDGQAHGRRIRALAAKFSFGNHAVQLQDIHLEAARGNLSGSAAYNFRNQDLKLDLTGHGIDLAEIPQVQRPHLQSAGVADFTVKGSGTLDQPVINGHFQIANLVLNGDKIGNFAADAITRGTQLTLTARSNFPKASLTLDASVNLQGNMPAQATLRFANLDVNPFLPERMRNQVTRQASLDGEAHLSGPLKQPHSLAGNLSIQQFSVEVEHVPIRSDGAVELSLANAVVSVQHCTLVSQDTRFTLAGTASFADDHPLNLAANGSLNLKIAEMIDPDVNSYGLANVDLKIGGTASDPVIAGKVEVAHAGLSIIDSPAGLQDLNGTLLFNQRRLQIENLTGRMGGGHVKLGGFVTYGQNVNFNITAEGNDIRFRYSGVSVTSDQSLHLIGTLQNSTLTGNITVTRFAQIPTSDLQYLLSQATAPPSVPNPNSPLNNLHLDVRIYSAPELTVQTSLAKLSGDVDLRLRGTAARPVLLGRVNVAEGDIKLGGTKYHLERGDISFLNPVRIDPVLDVEATTRVRDYDITIGLHGTMERLNTTYRSDPPLSSDDIISLLAFGTTQTENTLGGGAPAPGFAESASGALLSSAINQAVTNRVSKLFGVSSIRINPAFGGPENDPYARLTVEQQVTNNITLTYVTDLARSGQEIIQFEYNINSEYTVQGLRDENGVVSFDLLIRKRKR